MTQWTSDSERPFHKGASVWRIMETKHELAWRIGSTTGEGKLGTKIKEIKVYVRGNGAL